MLASIVCILLPVSISMIVYNTLTREAVKEQAMSNAQESLRLVEGYVTRSFQSMLDAANFVQLDPEMILLLKEIANDPAFNEKENIEDFDLYNTVLTRLESQSAVNGEKLFITIQLANDVAIASYPWYEYDPKQLVQESWSSTWNEQTGYQSYWLNSVPTVFRTEKAVSAHQISLARTLRDASGRVYGYTIVTILESEINQLFEKMAAGQEIMVVDPEGTIVSHADSGRVGQRFEYAKAANGAPLASAILNIDNRDYLVTKLDLPVTSWNLVSLRPYAEAAHKINSIFSRVFVFQLLFGLVFLLLLVSLIRTITTPLVRLGQVAKKVELGNLEVRSNIRSSDEVGHLSRSFDQMLERIKEMIREISVNQARKREAEIAMLQAQINPHFLFNVLNSIRMKILRNGDKSSAEMLSSLSRLLRMTIDPQKENILLADEVEIVMDYVQLMNMRQKERAELVVDMRGPGFTERVPRFFLQPIIENAMIHGLSQRAGTIRLTAKQEGPYYVVRVADDGVGMEPEELVALKAKLVSGEPTGSQKRQGFSGIGITNVYERMKMQFGPEFEMEIESRPGEGTCVTLYIPMSEEAKDDV